MKSRILTSFSKYTDSGFETKASSILASMQGNKNFPSPSPTLKLLQQSISDYSTALVGAKSRDKMKVSLKKDARKALTQTLTALANYVTMIANGDRTIKVSSGFDVTVETKTAKMLGQVQGFTVKPGANSGEVIITLNAVTNAQRYICFYSLTPVENDAWQIEFKRSPSFVIKGLQSLKQYSFRVAALGPNDQVVYSEVIMKMIL